MKYERFKKLASFGGAIALSAATIVTAMMPETAAARSYDGYCYQKNDNTRTKGTVIGAITGAVIGSNVAGHGNKTGGSVLGAVVGGVVGSQIGGQVKETSRANCMSNRYYIYQSGYYAPPPPPHGYRVAYFYDRPRGMNYVRPMPPRDRHDGRYNNDHRNRPHHDGRW